MKKKVILVIRDGWGVSNKEDGNYIIQADTQNTDYYEKNYPYTTLKASGIEVGIPDGKMGNSEVGHLHIGAGKIIPQSLLQINNSIDDGDFFVNETWINSLENAKKYNSKINIVILMQEAGVHSHIKHLIAYVKFLKENNFDNYNLHLITDGRDHNSKTAISFLQKIKLEIGEHDYDKVKTISGRFYAMDRNNNLDRTELYFNTIAFGKTNEVYENIYNHILESYNNNITDEFIKPAKRFGYTGFSQNDSLVILNFRTDREIQISKMFCDNKKMKEMEIKFYTITKYYKEICSEWAYDFPNIKNTLSEILIENNKKQLRLAESEKAAHVTFFFDGQKMIDNKLIEKRILKSPEVKTYDLAPEMRVLNIAKEAVETIEKNDKDFILVNFANADMVGHTGEKEAILKAVETADRAIKKIADEVLKKDEWVLLLAADHGNAEEKVGNFKTSHTLNPIPFSVISKDEEIKKIKLKKGLGLKNISATVLQLMGIPKTDDISESIIE